MKRVIIRYRGAGDKPEEDVRVVRALPNAKVLDETSRMLLVELPEAAVTGLAARLPNWNISEERTHGLPKPTPDLRVKERAVSKKK